VSLLPLVDTTIVTKARFSVTKCYFLTRRAKMNTIHLGPPRVWCCYPDRINLVLLIDQRQEETVGLLGRCDGLLAHGFGEIFGATL
jgi:hypothetical protein